MATPPYPNILQSRGKPDSILAAALALAISAPAHATVVTDSINTTVLANAIAGSGVTISNAVLTFNTGKPSGTFIGGASSVGFDKGIVLATGTTDCVAGPNKQASSMDSGSSTSLKFDFTSLTRKVFLEHLFASEEYTQHAPGTFNDTFELRMNGTNIALLRGNAGLVQINNVDGEANQPAACINQHLEFQHDGLTTVLTASASLLAGTNTFEFPITDVGDTQLDSDVFIQAGSFSGINDPTVPEPGSLVLMGLALAGAGAMRRLRGKKA